MHEVEVKLSTMHLGGRKKVQYSAILKPSYVSAFFNNIYGGICCISEIFLRFLKSVVQIPEEQHLGLESLH